MDLRDQLEGRNKSCLWVLNWSWI